MRTAPRRMFLFARRHVARAHHAAFFLAARADTDTPQRRTCERSVVVRTAETGLDRPRAIVRTEAQIRVRLSRINRLSGIHAVIGIPKALELAECVHQLRAEHLRQECAARLAVAVLAGDRPAVIDDDVGRAIDELTKLLNAG